MAESPLSKITEFYILIVEDDLITNRAVELALNKKGFNNILKAANADEAFDCVSNHNVRLIIMDMELGQGTNGIEVANKIAELNYIPVIFITGNSDDESFYKALESYPINIINKPIDFKQLLNCVICALNVIR